MTHDQRQTLKKGDHIGVYEIKAVIHVGRSDIIYRIWNEHMNTVEVLAEYFPCDLATRLEDGHTVGPKSENEQAVFEYGQKKFLEQAESLSDIEQPNIIRVHNKLEFNNTGYMIMDDVSGTSLSKLTGSSVTISQTELEYILTSLLEGLQKVHEQSTFHGDIHPSNIVIRKNGEPVLIDFAAERMAVASKSDSPEQFLRAGYASAELYNGNLSLGAASDLYSLGATLYRCITKTDPVLAPERLSAIDNNEPDPHKSVLESVGSEYSETFLKTIFRMLDPDAKKRYQSAAEVLRDLKQSNADADTESAEGEHKPADDSQLLASTDLGRPRALWVGAAVIVILIVFGLWTLQKDEKQMEILVPETNMTTVAVLKKQKVQPAEAAKEKSESRTAVVSELAPEIKSTEVSAQLESDKNISDQKPDSQVDALAAVEKTSLLSSDQERSAKSTDVSHKIQEFSTEIKQSPTLDTQVSTTADDKEELIEQHLAAAEDALRNYRLTTPPGDNAYQNYQAVFELDPKNAEAGKGLRLIVERYVWLIERSIEQNNFNYARIYFDRAEGILPSSPEVKRLRVVLKGARN